MLEQYGYYFIHLFKMGRGNYYLVQLSAGGVRIVDGSTLRKLNMRCNKWALFMRPNQTREPYFTSEFIINLKFSIKLFHVEIILILQ